jgi:Fic family protein
MRYNWQQKDWMLFQYEEQSFDEMWRVFLDLSGQSQGALLASAPNVRDESLINLLVIEAIKTSVIEGEYISRIDLISSIRKNLGFAVSNSAIKDKRSAGIAQLLIHSRNHYEDSLSEAILFEWHRLLMQGNYTIEVGQWRTHPEPMQVISGAMGKEKVHFEAPPSPQISLEMERFIAWFNTSLTSIKNPIIRSAIAHLYFESIHPFEDGNGRIGRIIAEKALAQGLNRPTLLSLSKTIEADKKAYYEALQQGQKSNKINEWIYYFGKVILQAQQDFMNTITFSIKKAAFFDTHKARLNERQQKVIKRMLADGEDAFEGGLNARKYQAIAKTSKATATRDLQDLLEKNLLITKGAGRSTNYQINL